jgi:hypothetical protein
MLHPSKYIANDDVQEYKKMFHKSQNISTDNQHNGCSAVEVLCIEARGH